MQALCCSSKDFFFPMTLLLLKGANDKLGLNL
jgi:hypothetical protein